MYYFCLRKIQRFHSTFFGSKTLDSAKWISYSIWRCNNLQIWENHIILYCFIVSPFYFKFKWTKKTNMFRHLYMHVNCKQVGKCVLEESLNIERNILQEMTMSLWLLYHCKTFNSTNALHGLTMKSWHRFGSVIMNKYLIFSNITHNIIGSDALSKQSNVGDSLFFEFLCIMS